MTQSIKILLILGVFFITGLACTESGEKSIEPRQMGVSKGANALSQGNSGFFFELNSDQVRQLKAKGAWKILLEAVPESGNSSKMESEIALKDIKFVGLAPGIYSISSKILTENGEILFSAASQSIEIVSGQLVPVNLVFASLSPKGSEINPGAVIISDVVNDNTSSSSHQTIVKAESSSIKSSNSSSSGRSSRSSNAQASSTPAVTSSSKQVASESSSGSTSSSNGGNQSQPDCKVTTCRLLVIGDSVSDSQTGWRVTFKEEALKAGYKFEYVGARKYEAPGKLIGTQEAPYDPTPSQDGNYEAFGGACIGDGMPSECPNLSPAISWRGSTTGLIGRIDVWSKIIQPPHVVIILAGHNDVFFNAITDATYAQRMDGFLAKLFQILAAPPRIFISGDGAADGAFPLLQGVAEKRLANGQKVYAIRSYEGVASDDGVHPTHAGHVKLAMNIFAQFDVLMKKP